MKVIWRFTLWGLLVTGLQIGASQQIQLQEVTKDNRVEFTHLLSTFSEYDWHQLGFSLRPDQDAVWNEPEVQQAWLNHLLEWQDEKEQHKLCLAYAPSVAEAVGFVAYSVQRDYTYGIPLLKRFLPILDQTKGFNGCHSWVWWFAVAPAHRRCGHGKKMLCNLKATVRGCSSLGVALEKDNDPARMFYVASGFVDQGSWDDEFDWMMCTLAD